MTRVECVGPEEKWLKCWLNEFVLLIVDPEETWGRCGLECGFPSSVFLEGVVGVSVGVFGGVVECAY